MNKRIRYSPEQKSKMKQQALDLLNKGKSQKEVAQKLGTTVTTLVSLLKGENYPGKRSNEPRAAAVSKAKDAANPVMQLAAKYQRLDEIAKAKIALEEEENRLKEEMKVLYDALGKTIFGADK